MMCLYCYSFVNPYFLIHIIQPPEYRNGFSGEGQVATHRPPPSYSQNTITHLFKKTYIYLYNTQ